MKKKLISLLICAALAGSVGVSAAGCGKTEEDINSFTIWLPHEVPDGYTSYNDLAVYKKLEEISGMKVKYVHGTYNDVQQLWVGDWEEYDAIMLSDSVVNGKYPGGLEKGVSDGVFWDLTDYMEEAMPEYMQSLETVTTENMEKFAKTDSGKYIGIYNVPVSDQGPWYGYVARRDWLEIYQRAEGIIGEDEDVKDLVTYDDWEGFLVYVKENLNGGKAPLFLYYTGVDMVGTLNAGFNVSGRLYLKNGTEVAYGAVQEEYRAYLDKMKEWYDMGLIDENFAGVNPNDTSASQPTTQAMDNYGESGYTPAQFAAFPMIYTYIHTYEALMSAMEQVYQAMGRPSYDLIPIAAPKQNAGDKQHIRLASQAPGYVAITKKVKSEEKLKKILEWFDYLYSEEGAMLMNYGTEGDTYNMVDGEPVFTEKITNPGGNLTFSDAISINCSLNFVFEYDWTRELQVVTDEERKAMEEVWMGDDAAYVLPTLILNDSESRVADQYELNLSTYANEFTVAYIRGKNSQSFEQFVETMKTTYHVDDLVRVYASAYQRFQAR